MQKIEATSAKLCHAGNALFLDWGGTLCCNFKRNRHDCDEPFDPCPATWQVKTSMPDRNTLTSEKVSLELDFGIEQTLKAKGPITDILHQLQKFMDDSLSDWSDDVERKRQQHYHLNHYTTTQLLTLSKLMVNYKQLVMDKPKELTELHALLSKVAPGIAWECMETFVDRAITEATKDIMQQKESVASPQQTEDQASARWQRIKAKAAELQKKTMFKEHVLIAAIQALGSTDLKNPAYIKWCNKHNDDIEKQPQRVTDNWQEVVSKKLADVKQEYDSLVFISILNITRLV